MIARLREAAWPGLVAIAICAVITVFAAVVGDRG
jgi:hypothetical protein